MLLLYATVFCVLFGGSSTELVPETICYGRNLKLPFRYTPPLFTGKLYLTPNRGSRKLLMDNGESKDPRLQVSIGSVEFTDLTERDEGTFSISHKGDRQRVIQLTIMDCAEKVKEYYGNTFFYNVPGQAEFLEFIPLHDMDRPIVLWNRTNNRINKGGRGQMKRQFWEINNLNQADMGHYNFRAKDHTLLTRILLEVNAHSRHYYAKVNDQLLIEYPRPGTPWTVTFTSMDTESVTLFQDGHLVPQYDNRIWDMYEGFDINPVQITDNGTFEFRDKDGNLAQTVQVEVTYIYNPKLVYIGIGVGILFAVIVCWCCARKCCCKKSSSKRSESAPQTASPLYYHDIDQPARPSFPAAPTPDYSHARYSTNSPVSRGHATIPLEPLVAPVGGQGVGPALSIGSDWLSSDPQPRFELKGVPSAPPLSSDSGFSNVYTSDKLNFISTNEHIGN